MRRSMIAAAMAFALSLAVNASSSAPAGAADFQSSMSDAGGGYVASGERGTAKQQRQERRSAPMKVRSAALPADSPELVVRMTAAGPIRVNRSIDDRMVGFVNDAVARGFRGRINCWSPKYDARGRRTHVEDSMHYRGEGCDFAQHRVKGHKRIVTHRVMYHVRDLAKKWRLRDGCTFRDCGHIDRGNLNL